MQLVASAGGDLLGPVAARGPALTQEDFWRQNTVPGVLRAAGSDPPVFYLLLHWWMQLLGTSDLAARLPSAIFGVLVVLLVHRLSATLFSEQAAWVAAALATLHPPLVRYSQEARGRMLAMVFTALATLVLVRLLRTSGERGLRRVVLTSGYAASATLALLTHNMCFGVFVGHAAYALLRVRERRTWLCLLLAWSTALACVAVWLASAADLQFFARMQALALQRALSGDSGAGYLFPSTPRFLAASLAKAFLSMAALDVQPTLMSLGLRVRDYAWVLAVPLILLWLGRGHRGHRDGEWALLGLIVGGVAAGLFSLAWWSGHTMALRTHYAGFGAPFLLPLLALGMIALFRRGRGGRAVLALIASAQSVAIAVGLRETYTDEVYWRRPPNGYAALAAQIAAVIRPGDVVVFPTWADAKITNLYLPRAPLIQQRVDPKPGADASILAGYGLPNTPQQTVVVVEPTREPIVVMAADGRERARLPHPIYW